MGLTVDRSTRSQSETPPSPPDTLHSSALYLSAMDGDQTPSMEQEMATMRAHQAETNKRIDELLVLWGPVLRPVEDWLKTGPVVLVFLIWKEKTAKDRGFKTGKDRLRLVLACDRVALNFS